MIEFMDYVMSQLPPLHEKTVRSRGGPQRPSSLSDLSPSIGERLRTLMRRQGRSWETLAALSGLGRKALDSVARGETIPTIHLLWKIANALGVPLGSLISVRRRPGIFVLRQADKKVISSADRRFTSRALFPYDGRPVEFYELTIAPRHAVNSDAHAPGTLESLVVVRGQIEITAGKEPTQRLEEGDAMVFEGDVPHRYRNLGPSEALLYLVISYLDPIQE